MIRFITKWFWTYRRWTWPPLAIVLVTMLWLLHTIITSGSSMRFTIFFLASLVGIITYRMLRGRMPQIWISVILLTAPLYMWGFWLLKPEWYLAWRSSQYFVWMVLVTVVLAWLTTLQNSQVVSSAKLGLVLLMLIAIAIGAYEHISWRNYWSNWFGSSSASSTTSTSAAKPAFDPTGTFEMVLKHKQKFRLVVPEGYRWDLVKPYEMGTWTTGFGDKDVDGNRIQVFEIVPPATEVVLQAKITKCTSPQMCAW